MRFELLGEAYDDAGDPKTRTFFQKVARWITEADSRGRRNWRKILSNKYAGYLVEGDGSSNLMESKTNFCAGCDGNSGGCDSCPDLQKERKGEDGMNDIELNRAFDEAVNGTCKSPEIEEQAGYDCIYQINKDGKLEQTRHSKLDQKAYEDSQRREQPIEESWDGLSLDEKFKAAFAK